MMEISGIPQLVRNFSRYPNEVMRGVVAATQVVQALIVNDARADHPYKDRTGNLTNSIQPGAVNITDTEVEAYVEARMSYATYVEFGTSRAKAYPFLTPAVLRNADKFKKGIAAQVQAIKL